MDYEEVEIYRDPDYIDPQRRGSLQLRYIRSVFFIYRIMYMAKFKYKLLDIKDYFVKNINIKRRCGLDFSQGMCEISE